MKLATVIAAYNEAENIEILYRRLLSVLEGLRGWEFEMIFVIEGNDGTHRKLTEVAGGKSHTAVLYRERPLGLAAAFEKGFSAVSESVDYVVTMDADLNHRPEEVPDLLVAARTTNSDVVVGSRYVKGSVVNGTPAWKRLLSVRVNRLLAPLSGTGVRDMTSGFRVYRHQVLRETEFENRGFAFLPEILIKAQRCGFRIVEHPILFEHRTRGQSKMGLLATTMSYIRLFFRNWLAM
jgi:dolichol-phosphate mannosyltransferase